MNEGMKNYLRMGNYEKSRYELVAGFFAGRKGKLLDIGCCEGGLKKYLAPGCEYYGVDGQENDFENYTQADLNDRKLPYEDGTFDMINCSAVLEHLFYPLEVLRECRRVLKDDGVILVSLPNDKGLSALYSQMFLKLRSYDDSIFGHHWRFSVDTARNFFGKEFRIVKEGPEFGPLFRRYLPFLKFKSLSTEWFMLGQKN